jgi:hypothetical protein
MGDGRVAYMVLVKRPEGKRQLGRTRRRWEDNIKIFKKRDRGGGGMDWIDVVQNRGSWQAFVNVVMKFRVLCNARTLLTS